jgi:hypothetical protein
VVVVFTSSGVKTGNYCNVSKKRLAGRFFGSYTIGSRKGDAIQVNQINGTEGLL